MEESNGNVPKKKSSRPILLTACCLTILLLAGCKERSAITSSRVESQSHIIITKSKGALNATVEWTGKSFIVVNKDPSDWQSVVLIACPVDMTTIIGGAYTCPLKPVKAGETIKVIAGRFIRAMDSKRLNMNETKLRAFIICEGNPFSYSSSKDARKWNGVVK